MAGAELAVGYVSLVVDTSKIGPAINRAFDGAGTSADKAGRTAGARFSTGVKGSAKKVGAAGVFDGAAADAEKAGRSAGDRFSAGISKTLKTAGALGIGLGFGAAAKSIVTSGNDVAVTLNSMQAQSQLTGDQMDKVRAKAQALGNDLTLPGVSAATASTALFELSKAGFDVDESMQAAKGSLQLAAAAGTDVETAVKIQAGALHAFDLEASNAGHVADVLANAANNSTASMEDIGYAMQASGTVANQFGVSIEDTAATLALLSNAGIQGSDAGTLLKSALLALTDTGEPATNAMEELGLKVYDAKGEFVGMPALFDQLKRASERMTPEMYNASTATLFGSDAMRLSGIAAAVGAEGLGAMQVAVGKQGTAAEVAAAKNKGLPGAMANAQNAAENLGLELYKLVQGPLTDLATSSAGFLNNVTGPLVSGLSTIGTALAAIPGPAMAFVAAMVALKATGIGTHLTNMQKSFAGYGQEIRHRTVDARDHARQMGQFSQQAQTQVQRLNALMSTPAGTQQAAAINAYTSSLQQFQRQAGLAQIQGTRTFIALNAAAGVASSGFNRLKSAASNLSGTMGGKWGIGLTAALVGIGAEIQSARSAEQAMERLRETTTEGAKAQTAFSTAVAMANGDLNDQALGAASKIAEGVLGETTALAERGHSTMEKLWHLGDNVTGNVLGMTDAWEKNYDKVSGAIERNSALESVMGEMKISLSDVGQIVAQGGAGYEELVERLNDTGTAGEDVAKTMTGLRDDLVEAREAAKNSTPGFFPLTEAIEVLADKSSSAEDKVNALKSALDILSGKPIEASAAMQKYNEVALYTAETTAELWDRTKGWGQVLVNQDGSVNTASQNGQKLYETLDRIKEATLESAVAGNDLDDINRHNTTQFEQLAGAAGLSEAEVRKMAEEMGLMPRLVETMVRLSGAEGADAQLMAIKELALATGAPVKIPVNAETQDVIKRLRDVGIAVDTATLPGTAIIDANTDQFDTKINQVIGQQIPAKFVSVIPDTRTWDSVMLNLLAPGSKTIAVVPEYSPVPGIIGPMPPLTPSVPRAAGGPITGGVPGRDSVHILGMPGEHMLTVADVQAMGGQGAVYDFRRSLHMAEGGAVPKGVMDAARAARSVTGNPYAWAGSGPSQFDCSGFIGWLQQILMGRRSNNRIYTTHSILAGQTAGLVSGGGPPGTWFQVGVNSEHMAGTLGGQPVEAGGSHNTSRIGPPAASATDGQFTNLYHLPNALIVGGAGTSFVAGPQVNPAWTESDENDLIRARLEVQRAQGEVTRVNSDPEATPLDKSEAGVGLNEAQGRVTELENKKRGTPLSPEAPALETTGMSEHEIEVERKRIAVEAARITRNDVYADPTKSADERSAADLDLIEAQNEYAKILSGEADESGTEYQGLRDRLKKLGADLAGVAVDSALEQLPFGIGETHWLDFPTSFPRSEVDAQYPITIGGEFAALEPYLESAPDWLKKMIHFKTVVADTGGWLEPGQAAINLSRKPEPIFNSPGQLAEFAGAMFPGGGANGGPSLTIEKVVGYSPQEVAREVMKQFRVNQMRFAGRS